MNHLSMAPDQAPVICVTGSAKRIGAAIITHMHGLGFRVIIHCHHSLTEAEELASSLNAKRDQSAQVVQADLCDMSQLPTLAQDIMNCFGQLDVLVHNASRFYPTELFAQAEPAESESTQHGFAEEYMQSLDQQWNELFSSNAKAPFFLTQLLKAELKIREGVVISLLDIHAADRPFRGYSIYNMAKSAHRMMVKSLSLELAPDIRVNGVAPGANIWPDEQSDQAITAHTQSDISQAIPLQRVGQPQDIADAVAYLAHASYVTGHVINIDGGRSVTLAGG